MDIDHEELVLPSETSESSPSRVAGHTFALRSSDSISIGSSPASRSSPLQADLKSKIGLVNRHPTMNGMFQTDIKLQIFHSLI